MEDAGEVLGYFCLSDSLASAMLKATWHGEKHDVWEMCTYVFFSVQKLFTGCFTETEILLLIARRAEPHSQNPHQWKVLV